ncbi:MAG: CPBP family intramembrane metalloprotease [Anaerolineae bacterium]|nr:CPBP family intramembrane metalloprotease [Anaerolineae bacterium]
MFKTLLARISAPESELPFSAAAGLSGLVALVVGMLFIGPTVALLIPGLPGNLALLLGWTLGGALAVGFIFVRLKTPTQRAALWSKVVPPPKGKKASPSTEGSGGLTAQELFFMLLLGVGFAITLDVISGRLTSTFLPEPELRGLYTPGQSLSALGWVIAILFMVGVQPLAEELSFRGLLLPSLRRLTGPWLGYLLTSLAGALFHQLTYSTPGGDFNALWFGLLAPLLTNLLFGGIRLYSGSTRAALLAHIGFGLFAIVKLVTLPG